MDLFDKPELIPSEVLSILHTRNECGCQYEELRRLHSLILPLGYTFDWYLDAQPFNLTKI